MQSYRLWSRMADGSSTPRQPTAMRKACWARSPQLPACATSSSSPPSSSRPTSQELKRSLARLKTASVDLLQLHNVRSKQQSLQRFREWKKQGVCRYVGITSTFRRDYPAVEAVLEREKPDFVQIDYSLDNRGAEKTILPLAAEIKAGVLTAVPYGNGRLFRAVHGKELPDWARVFANSWGQFFLKYLLGDPRVTAVIPGTGDPGHMADNAGAMRGPLPDPDQRRRMVEFVEAL